MREEKYWNEEIETKSRDEILSIQETKLIKKIAYVYENSSFHRKLFDEKGARPEDIKSLEDFQSHI